MNGFIKLHRKLLEWGWFQDSKTLQVWLYLLLNASFEDNEFLGTFVPKGSLITGRKKIASACGLTEMEVRYALEHLKKTKEISVKTTNKFSLISIEKWGDYQCLIDDNNQQTTNKQPTNNQQTTTTKECKECKEGKEIYKEGNKSRFVPPSLEEIQEEINLKGYSIDAESFYSFYDSKGWMVGKNKMKSWKSALVTWSKRDKKENEGVWFT